MHGAGISVFSRKEFYHKSLPFFILWLDRQIYMLHETVLLEGEETNKKSATEYGVILGILVISVIMMRTNALDHRTWTQCDPVGYCLGLGWHYKVTGSVYAS